MATAEVEEEWGDGVDDFFTEFSLAASHDKSTRRKNADAHQAKVAQSQKKARLKEADRDESAKEARRRIAAAVISRATAKEIEAAARDAKKHQEMCPKKGNTGVASAHPRLSSFSLSGQHHGSSTAASSSPSSKEHSSTARQSGAEPPKSRFSQKRQKMAAKSARKAARKADAKVHCIPYRRVSRRQRR
ncbi:hypothetical protein LPMP_343120 [Leishmania panamensis]|uniref:Uncharacterized protein n=3 Tax=Leishmania guyanensis species complex TaxID=38579 RepID=A0A088S0K7_LEIPA|nr:hypothetical protein LPMP_343120 [Leishmania panamensis]AIO01938.1 hypothetical protein LPMP_343120 [Leishmania panamensis]CCM19156.1 hypothetical protein, conserved [Leishmania guyanensis]